MRPNFEIENKYSDEACTFLEKFFPFSETNKTKSIATIKNGGQCNSFLSDRNFFAAILNIRVIAITKSCF